jgi:hypothetical protein
VSLGVAGFRYADLYDPQRLAALYEEFDRWFAAAAPEPYAKFSVYRACKGEGLSAIAQSEALLAAAPYVGRFVAKVFRIEAEADAFRDRVRQGDPIWRFRKDFVKKRVLRADAGKGWTRGAAIAEAVARAALQALTQAPIGGTTDEEGTIAAAALPLLEIDEVARRAAKAGGAAWTDDLRSRARKVYDALRTIDAALVAPVEGAADDAALGRAVAVALDAL